MILKLIKKEKYDGIDSTQSIEQLETSYLEIKNVKRILPLSNRSYLDDRDNKIYNSETLMITFPDGSEQTHVIGNFTSENHIEYVYQNIFLMNDNGKTIEKII